MANYPKELPYDFSYRTGYCPFRACQYDSRFSYIAYVPDRLTENSSIIIPVHATDRTAETYRDRFADLGKKTSSIVLSPLFPAGIATPEDIDEYKFLIGKSDIRYDLILKSMIEEVVESYNMKDPKIFLYGFSGGAHFVHRFAILYPEMIHGLSIVAPGCVTLPLEDKDWWVGVRNVEHLFNKKIDWSQVDFPVQMLVGGNDVDPREIELEKSDPFWMDGANDAGKNRIERIAALRDAWQSKGVTVDFRAVPGVNHDDASLWPLAAEFFLKSL